MVVQADAVRAAVAAAENGDFAAAEQKLLEVPPGHPVRALASLEVRFLRGEKVAGQALELARSVPGYGSAWGFAAVAARHERDERGALTAARRAAELQPDGGWGKVAAELEGTLTATLLGEGSALLKGGDPSGALARAREALEVNPNAASARILAVRALLALDETRAAAELVPGPSRHPRRARAQGLGGRGARAVGPGGRFLQPDAGRRSEAVRRSWRRLAGSCG